MSRYKDADEILEAMDTWPKYGCRPDGRFFKLTKETEADYVPYVHYDDMVQAVTGTPVQDVVPIIHAHWEIIYESSAGVTDARCSNCGYESLAYENDVHTDENCNYCPCCGAKMDEEVE